MKIVVIGGTGLIGSKLISSFRGTQGVRGSDYEVLGVSRSTGVDVITGAGLADALVQAHVIVDVTDSPSRDPSAALKFFQTAGRTLAAAEAAAAIRHHVTLSVVGAERNSEAGYLRAKVTQEDAVRASGVPYTIVRSTQFFESTSAIAQSGIAGDAVHASPALVQPIASDDVAAALGGIALGEPENGTVEIAGPQCLPLDEVILRYLLALGDRRPVISDIHARCFGLELNDKSLTPSGSPRIGPTQFEQWLKCIAQNENERTFMHTIDLRSSEPRSPYDELGGVKLLARVVDKGRAVIGGTLGPYRFFDCPLDRVFFETLGASPDEFLDMLRQAYASHKLSNAAALADMRESLECNPEVSDECFLDYAQARDADSAALTWLFERRRTPPGALAAINAAVDCLPPESFVDWE